MLRQDDRIALRAVVFILAALAMVGLAPRSAHAAAPGLVPGDWCQEVDGPRVPWSKDQRERTRERVDLALDELRVSNAIRAFHRVVVCRESYCGEASVRHRLGTDRDGVPEHGLGTHGLSLRWQAGKWGPDADPGLCTPEASVVVAHELVWRAVTRYGARSLLDVQAVYSGAVDCADGACRFLLPVRRARGLCSRLAAYGVDCRAAVDVDDLGVRLDLDERREFALALARRYLGAWLGRGAQVNTSSAPVNM